MASFKRVFPASHMINTANIPPLIHSLPVANMSLLSLPVELLLHIVSDVRDKNDQQCLRIACRAFYNIIEPAYGALVGSRWKQFCPYFRCLFKPGNIFHDRGVTLCGQCLLIKLDSCFPITNLRMDTDQVCEACVLDALRYNMRWRGFYGTLQYGENTYDHCAGCNSHFPEDEIQRCGMNYNIPWNYCARCHRHYCCDPWCGGWPQECALRRPVHSGDGMSEAWRVDKPTEFECGCNGCAQALSDLLRLDEQLEIDRLNRLSEQLEDGVAALEEIEGLSRVTVQYCSDYGHAKNG